VREAQVKCCMVFLRRWLLTATTEGCAAMGDLVGNAADAQEAAGAIAGAVGMG